MIIVNWRPHRSGKVARLCPGRARHWAHHSRPPLLPDKPVLRDGKLKRGINKNPVYVPIANWRDSKTSARFSAAVVELLLAKYPDALGADAAAAPEQSRPSASPGRTGPSGSRTASAEPRPTYNPMRQRASGSRLA
jgi:hypothetical protein